MARRFDEFVRDTTGRKARGDTRPRTRTGRRGDTRDRTRRGSDTTDTTTTRGQGNSGQTGAESLNVPENALTGLAKKAGLSGAGVTGLVRDTPTALISPVLRSLGMGQFGGAGDLLASVASPNE